MLPSVGHILRSRMAGACGMYEREDGADGPDGMIAFMTDCGNFLVADWCPEGEMAVEQ